MSDLVRLLLLIVFAGAAVTALGGVLAWRRDEGRRLARYCRRALGGEPDAMLIAKGRGAAAAFRLESDQLLTMRNMGAQALLYRLDMLMGAELLVDGQVVGRTYRGEVRRALDQVAGGAERVSLRLIFDDAREPDFDLDLWPPPRPDGSPPAAAIEEGRRWLARTEAILRRPPTRPPAAAPMVARTPPPDDLEADDDDEDYNLTL